MQNLKMCLPKIFSIHSFLYFTNHSAHKKQTLQPFKLRNKAQASLLTWYFLKRETTHKHTHTHKEYIIDVVSSFFYRTTKLALWREYETDCVPELPQFTLVCHTHGILNTLAKTCLIKYTVTEQYTRT